MQHFDEHTLQEYVLGTLNADRRAVVSEHLRVCTVCQAQIQRYEHEVARVKSVLRLAHESRPSDCPSPERLALYLDSGVDAPERATIERHLSQCSDCRVSLQAIRHELALVRAMNDEELAALDQQATLLPHSVLATPRGPGVFRIFASALGWRYVNIVLMASVLGLGGWGPERFRPHFLVSAAFVAVSPVLGKRYFRDLRRDTFGRRLAWSIPIAAFLVAWVFPSYSYWCLALALIGGGLVLISLSVESASNSDDSAAAPHRAQGKANSQKLNVD